MENLKYNFKPEGDPDKCEIAVVCEKPASDEIVAGRLLAGTSGRRVRNHMYKVGFDAGTAGRFDEGARPSQNVWLTNAVQSFNETGNPTVRDVIRDQSRLYQELSRLPRLRVIIAMGNMALASLTNFHCVRQAKNGSISGIASWRGSRVRAPFGTTVVPTFHPSFYLHGEWRFAPIVDFDVRRAANETKKPRLEWPRRTFYIEPADLREVFGWLDTIESDQHVSFEAGPAIAYDIEAVKGRHGLWYVSCISFSTRPDVAYCIPFVRGRSPYWSPSDEIAIWVRLAALFARSDRSFVAQNGAAFDNWVLRRHGIAVPFYHRGFDTMLAHRYLAPDLPHGLDFLTSIYTDEPYYKDESGRGEEFGRVNDRQFWVYNCKDSACTLEAAVGIRADLAETRQLDFFYRECQPRVRIAAAKIECGFRVDKTVLGEVKSRVRNEIIARQQSLRDRFGWVPNTRSYLDMGRFLTHLGVRFSRTAKGRPATAEEQLLMYAHRYPNSQGPIQDCIDITQRAALESNFLQLITDSAGFYHAIYDPCHTKSGRDSSQSAHEGGPQLHNVPSNIRHIFVPDRSSHVLTTGDLKQAEAMYVAWDAQDPFLIAAFESGKDIHRIRGCVIFRNWTIDYRRAMADMLPSDDLIITITEVCPVCAAASETTCNHSERFISKVSGHAFAYRMGPRKFVTKVLPPAGVFISEAEGKRIKGLVVTPAISAWHDKIDACLTESRWLENPFGRRREFYGIHDEEMLREALAWLASSTVTDVTTPAERLLHETFEGHRRYDECRVVTQTHDSITVNHPPTMRDEVRDLMTKAFSREIWLHGRRLVIPVDFKTGSNWGFRRDSPKVNTLISSATE